MGIKKFYSEHEKAINIIMLVILPAFIIGIVLLIKNLNKVSSQANHKGGKNNPGNIRNTSIKWGGEITQPGDVFESFDTIENGVRAMYLNLLACRNIHGDRTIRQIICRWAPPTDKNNTEGYISFVSKRTGIGADVDLSVGDFASIISAMSKQEGNIYVTPEQVNNIV